MGAHVDYIILDGTAAPASTSRDYSERLALMPHSYYATEYREYALSTGALMEQMDLPWGLQDRLVFLNSNHLFKLSPGIIDVWANMLHRIPRR